jgi:protoporphyrin/coproporphyrin ferrochelatase
LEEALPFGTDTEYVADCLRHKLQAPVLTFHRYLPVTHKAFIEEIKALESDEIHVFPMFPQFTYATTGSIAQFFWKHFSLQIIQKFKWIKSYPTHPAFIEATVRAINSYLALVGLQPEEVYFLFSAHGLPQIFVDQGDMYARECLASVNAVMQAFPKAEGILCYQSKFGRDEWLKPYTVDVCNQITMHANKRKHCVFVPISFTSDHIETLFEIEEQYMPLIQKAGLHPFRMPALSRCPDWIDAIIRILHDSPAIPTQSLLR